MFFGILALLTGLSISGVAIYYSVAGLVSIFAAMPIPIIVMGVSLESAKLVATVWLKQNWSRAPLFLKTYLIIAVVILMAVTSMGIFGYLSKAHSDQTLVTGDVVAKLNVFDEKIKVEKDTISTNRKALAQLDASVDQIMSRSTDEKGASKASALRQSQAKERTRLLAEIDKSNKTISALNEQRAPIAAENRKVEAEVGPIKYIAALLYGDNPDANLLERAVRWVIIMIVVVFDPLAVILLLASQYSFQWARDDKAQEESPEPEEEPITVEDFKTEPVIADAAEQSKEVAKALDAEEPLPVVTAVVEVPKDNRGEWPPANDLWPFPKAEITKIEPEPAPVSEEPKIEYKILEDVQEPDYLYPDTIQQDVDPPEEPVTEAPHPKSLVGAKQNPLHALRQEQENKPADVVEEIGVDAWNKMLQAAEAEALKENTVSKQTGEVQYTRPQFTEVIEPQGYIQNEEQNTSNVWNKTVAPISSAEYQQTSEEAYIKSLITMIEKGTVDVEKLSEADKKAIADFLAKSQ
jgi:hypothetical protein